MKGLTAVVFAAMLSLGNAQTPAATPSPLPTTATLANPAVVYITKFVGTWCTGAVSMVTAYPLGVCITTVNSAGIAVGGMKLSTLPSPGNMVIQYTTFKSSTCGDSGDATQQWLTTSSMPSITSAQVLAGASPIPAVDQCTDNTYASAGASFRTTLGTVAPSAANPNPLGFPAMRISSYVPASASGSTCAQNYATPVVVYESVMNTCQSTGAVTLVSPITVASSIASAPSPSPPSSVPTLPPTVPVETVMGLQSLTSVCVNGIVSEQYFSNPTCSYDVQEQLLGYAATQGPSICVNGNADMQMPGAARYPMLFQGIALNYQMYAGPYKLVTCSSGDPVPPNANQAGDGWIYTAGYSSGDCSGSPQAMFQGKPTSVCIFDPATNGGVIYKCARADGYSAFFFSDPGCTKPATYTPNGEAPFPGGCQTNPSLFSPKMQWIKTPNFNSQQNLCQAGSARPLGLGVSMVQYESAGCAGRSIGFVSLAFGSHNTSGQVTLPSGTQTSNPQTFSTLSCSGTYWTSVDQAYPKFRTATALSRSVTVYPLGCVQPGVQATCDGTNPATAAMAIYTITAGGVAGVVFGMILVTLLTTAIGFYMGKRHAGALVCCGLTWYDPEAKWAYPSMPKLPDVRQYLKRNKKGAQADGATLADSSGTAPAFGSMASKEEDAERRL